jgi:hypothetical protein
MEISVKRKKPKKEAKKKFRGIKKIHKRDTKADLNK